MLHKVLLSIGKFRAKRIQDVFVLELLQSSVDDFCFEELQVLLQVLEVVGLK